jgi:hypothetical protein
LKGGAVLDVFDQGSTRHYRLLNAIATQHALCHAGGARTSEQPTPYLQARAVVHTFTSNIRAAT